MAIPANPDRRPFVPYDAAACLLLAVLAIIVALTYRRYGFTTDEGTDNLKAVRVVEFFASFGRRDEISKIDDVNVYGAMPDVLALLLQKLIPSLSFDSRHLVSAAFGITGVYFTYRLGRAFAAPAVGFFAMLFLACNPMWFGHMFFDAKDIPFAAMLVAALYYCLSALTGLCKSWWIWPKLGLATGLLAATKLVGVLVLGVIGLVSLACLICIPGTTAIQANGVLLMRLAKIAICATVGCLLCFAAFWPQFFLWSPAQLVRIVGLFMNFDLWQGFVQIHGEYISFDQVPWYYTSVYFIISMPLLLLALMIAGAAMGIRDREPLVIACVVVCIAFPAYQAIGQVRAYNGYRHFIFLLPFMMLIAAYAIGFVAALHRWQAVRIATPAAVLIAIMPIVISMYRLFPYQYSFYNSLVGGIRGADGRYYIDYWRSALREALGEIEHADQSHGVVDVYGSCGAPLNFADHPRLNAVDRMEDADYIVVLRRNCDPRSAPVPDLPIVGEVRRQGVVFATVYWRQRK